MAEELVGYIPYWKNHDDPKFIGKPWCIKSRSAVKVYKSPKSFERMMKFNFGPNDTVGTLPWPDVELHAVYRKVS